MILAFLLSCFGFAQNNPFAPPSKTKENCVIETSTKYKTGETKTNTHTYAMKDKAACEKSRKAHSVVFDSSLVEKIETKLVWRGGK